MTIPSFAAGVFSATNNTNNLLGINAKLTNLQTQLSTGKVSQTYAGLGDGRVTALQFQKQLSQANGYQATSNDTSQRLLFANNALDTINTSTNSFQSTLNTGSYSFDASGRVVTQGLAYNNFQLAIDSLNTKYGDRFLFSGRASDTQPVNNADLIINGDASHDGLKQVILERNQADLGVVAAIAPAIDPASTGRLVTGLVGTTTSINEDVAGSPFGFKLGAGAPTSSTANIVATGPAGALNTVSFNVTAQPVAGDSVSLTLTLPDGTTKSLKFSAAINVSGGSSAGTFQIGATTAQTATNLNAAITASLNLTAASSLKAASSVVATQSFFSQTVAAPAQRVGTLPATTATTLVASFAVGAKATQAFYNGEEQATASAANINTIRNSVASRVDKGLNVGVGIQGNEPAFVKALAAFGLLAVASFNKADPNDRENFTELTSRVASNLGNPLTQSVKDVQIQVATTASVVKDAQARLKQKASQYQTLIDDVVNSDTTTISAQLLTLQTQLEASYQTTNILSKLTLTNYLR
jgi:flagellar hook-associated protein 3 FlgL